MCIGGISKQVFQENDLDPPLELCHCEYFEYKLRIEKWRHKHQPHVEEQWRESSRFRTAEQRWRQKPIVIPRDSKLRDVVDAVVKESKCAKGGKPNEGMKEGAAPEFRASNAHTTEILRVRNEKS